MVQPAYGLDHATEQPRLQVTTQAGKSGPIDGRAALPVELQHVHSGARQRAVTDRPFDATAGRTVARARRRGAAARPQPRPFETRIDIRGIVEPLHAAREKRGREAGPRYAEQRTQQAHFRLLDQGRHAGKAVGTALAGRPHGHGLGLIVSMMGEQQVQEAAPEAFIAQQPVPCFRAAACRPARGFAPDQPRIALSMPWRASVSLVADASPAEFGAQAVVDDEPDHAAATFCRPVVRQQRQCQ